MVKNEQDNRRQFTAAFKTKLCLDALKERETMEGLAKKYDFHTNQINSWKREFIQKSESVFETDSVHGRESKEILIEIFYSLIGELSVANDLLKKKCCKYVFIAKSHYWAQTSPTQHCQAMRFSIPQPLVDLLRAGKGIGREPADPVLACQSVPVDHFHWCSKTDQGTWKAWL